MACSGSRGASPERAVAEIQATPAEHDRLHAVRRMVAADPAGVRVAVGDETVELPPSLVRLLSVAADALESGDIVALMSEEAEVNPAQAARLLGVSRQYVDRLVAAEVLPARRLPQSSYRRIPVRAVLAHKAVKDRKRAGISRIVDSADEAGLEY
ncbi:MAG: hypothetical protein ACRD0K_26695 [Egibacteraceae bacterium]